MSDEETRVEETEKEAERDDGGQLEMDSEEVDEQLKEVEENPPDRLEDWPEGKAKYRTIGGGDANESWEDGPTRHLGPSDVRYYEDGTVTVKGEEVDNPEDFKGDPIPGGPTDPDAPDDPSGLEDKDKGDDDEPEDGESEDDRDRADD
jgi:hypothetical protein